MILKACASELAAPLSTLFNFSFQEGLLPCQWLSARVRPLFKKKGDPSSCLNYRPISLTSCISKCMEKILKNELTSFYEQNNLMQINNMVSDLIVQLLLRSLIFVIFSLNP